MHFDRYGTGHPACRLSDLYVQGSRPKRGCYRNFKHKTSNRGPCCIGNGRTYHAAIVLVHLIHRSRQGISFTGLPKVEAVKGTFADLDLITKLASEADVVINTADSDSLELINALLRGLQQRHDKERVATLIHTSGAGVFLDDAQGSYNPGGRVWSVRIVVHLV